MKIHKKPAMSDVQTITCKSVMHSFIYLLVHSWCLRAIDTLWLPGRNYKMKYMTLGGAKGASWLYI
jgi:hypothetical protein